MSSRLLRRAGSHWLLCHGSSTGARTWGNQQQLHPALLAPLGEPRGLLDGVVLTGGEALRQDALADAAVAVNGSVENIGARRLQTVLEKVMEEISFSAADRGGEQRFVACAAGAAARPPDRLADGSRRRPRRRTGRRFDPQREHRRLS